MHLQSRPDHISSQKSHLSRFSITYKSINGGEELIKTDRAQSLCHSLATFSAKLKRTFTRSGSHASDAV